MIFGLVLFIGTGTFMTRHALACELVPQLGSYTSITADAHAAPGLDSVQFEHFSDLLNSARERIGERYGPTQSRPRLIVTDDPVTARRWGANETASMHRLPWRACIVIGPMGLNVDVVAHEILHAEIQHRVGFWRLLRDIPVWFDEGAALTVDYRAPFLPENIELNAEQIEAVMDLVSARSFFSGQVRQNYQAARLAVIPLIDNESFYEDLERIADGASFDEVFLPKPLSRARSSRSGGENDDSFVPAL
jgi:hypothetical protein